MWKKLDNVYTFVLVSFLQWHLIFCIVVWIDLRNIFTMPQNVFVCLFMNDVEWPNKGNKISRKRFFLKFCELNIQFESGSNFCPVQFICTFIFVQLKKYHSIDNYRFLDYFLWANDLKDISKEACVYSDFILNWNKFHYFT